MDTRVRNTSDQTSKVLQQDNDRHRLPCRGCTRDCSNYSRCNGTPWQLARISHHDDKSGLAQHKASDPQHSTQTG